VERWEEALITGQPQIDQSKLKILGPVLDGPVAFALVRTKRTPTEPYVVLAWGGGFASYNLKIGPTNAQMKPMSSEYTREWKPGIVVGHSK
jgi:hypothetical protein